MYKSTKILIPLTCVLVGLFCANRASAKELTVSSYCELTLTKIQRTYESWRDFGVAPTEGATEAVYASYGTTAAKYLAFGSKHNKGIKQHLATNKKLADHIKLYSDRVAILIEQIESGK